MQMTINQLTWFCELAQREHFWRTADELFISESSLSRAMSRLSEELGVTLFIRKGRNITLTEAGQAFLPYAQRSLEQLRRGITLAQEAYRSGDRVRVGCIAPMLGEVPEFLRGLPRQIRPEICTSQTTSLVAGLRSHLYDLIFCSYVPGEPDICFLPILEQPYVVVMRTDHPLAQRAELHPKDLDGVDLIVHLEQAYNSVVMAMLRDYGALSIIRGTANEDMVLKNMVRGGMGVFIGSDYPDMHADGLVMRPLKQDRYHRYIYLAYLRDIERNDTIESILTELRKKVIEQEGIQPKPVL